MSVSGQVVEVVVRPRGSELVADAAVSATTVTVQDPTPFDAGAQVRIDGTTYTLVDVAEVDDPDDSESTNGVLTLDAGLAATVTEGTTVDLWSGSQVLDDVVLNVVTTADEPPVSVTVSAGQRKDWRALEGPVEPPVTATLSEDLLVLLDAPGYSPTFDSTMSSVPLIYAARGSNQTIPNNTWTTVNGWFVFPSDRISVDPTFGYMFTVEVDGWYDLRLGVTFALNSTGSRAIRPHIYGVDGSDKGPMRQVKIPADGSTTVETAQLVRLVAGQRVTFEVWQSSTGDLEINGSQVLIEQAQTDCSIRWVGPL